MPRTVNKINRSLHVCLMKTQSKGVGRYLALNMYPLFGHVGTPWRDVKKAQRRTGPGVTGGLVGWWAGGGVGRRASTWGWIPRASSCELRAAPGPPGIGQCSPPRDDTWATACSCRSGRLGSVQCLNVAHRRARNRRRSLQGLLHAGGSRPSNDASTQMPAGDESNQDSCSRLLLGLVSP
jgi:hypothetical protein